MDTSLRKQMLEATRHVPEAFGLVLDGEGFTTVYDFVEGFNATQPVRVKASEVLAILESDAYFHTVTSEEAVRFRALCLHTTDQFDYPVRAPTNDLFLAAAKRNLGDLLDYGVQPLRTRYIPLYESSEACESNWTRYDNLSLRVRAVDAHEAGVPFYHYCDQWYCEELPVSALELD